jgi:N-dimethylarginine dimethylaminohydrolase
MNLEQDGRFNGHSMVGTLRRVLVCTPDAAGWNDKARLSRGHELGFGHAPDFLVAQRQHERLRRILERAGVEVIDLPASTELTLDGVYSHDASLATDLGLVLMHPGKINRIPEAKQQGEFCRQLGIPIASEIRPPGNAEAGDMVWIDARTLLAGHGYRTNAAGIEQMRGLLGAEGVQVITAPLPYGPGPSACLHLMSLISMLDEKTALVDLPWLAVETVELLKSRGYRFVEIDPSERDTLACNVLSLGRNRLVAIEENARTNERLRGAGFEVYTFPGSEVCINGRGGPTCLTRPLLRD